MINDWVLASVLHQLGALWCDDAPFIRAVRAHFPREEESARLWRLSANVSCSELHAPMDVKAMREKLETAELSISM